MIIFFLGGVIKRALEELSESKKNNKKAILSSRAEIERFCIGSAKNYVTIINKTECKSISERKAWYDKNQFSAVTSKITFKL